VRQGLAQLRQRQGLQAQAVAADHGGYGTDAEGSGFGSDTNKVTIIGRDLAVEELPLLTKYDVSNRILDRVKGLFRD